MLKTRTIESGDRLSPIPAARFAAGLAIATLAILGALHAASPEFDPSWRMVSEYALGQYPWLLSLFFLSWGLSTWALVAAVRPYVAGRAGRTGLVFLVLAGLGEAMAAVFDINQDLGHGIAGLLGILGLPIAAVLITTALLREGSWAGARPLIIGLAALTWLALVALIASLILMTIQVAQAYGGQLPQSAPAVLPAGVLRLVGWADRLVVVANCAWVVALAWRVSVVTRVQMRRPAPLPSVVLADADQVSQAS
jgi:hypothetical protein